MLDMVGMLLEDGTCVGASLVSIVKLLVWVER